MLMFLGALIMSHIFLGAIIHYIVQSHFYTEDYQHISEKFTAIKQSNLTENFDHVTMESSYFSALKIWTIENEMVTYQNSDIALPVDALQFFLINQNVKRSWEWDNENSRYLAFSFNLNDEYTVVIGTNINHHIEFFYTLSIAIFWSIVGISLASGLCSILIINNGLRPLKRIELYLAKIHPNNIAVRIPTKQLPIELQALSEVQNAMLDRLDQGFKRLNDFSSDIAHELKTPLSNMITQTQVVLSKDRDLPEYQDTLFSNLEELERINKTINDTLYLAKSENSLLYQNDEWLNTNKEISLLVEYHNITAADKAVSIDVQGEGEIFFDKSMFQQAVNNLLANATRHAASNSIINIIIKQSDNTTTIGVTNRGDTIPEAALPFIFDRFYRADKSREHKYSIGAGLGLAITKSIIEAYDGTITARSIDGKTEFWICFRHMKSLQ
jgi:two-component system heavy metal sensor histidine kinase CusS